MPSRPTPNSKPRFVRTRKVLKRVWNSKLGRWALAATTAAALSVGGHQIYKAMRVPKNGKPPVVRIEPLQRSEIKTFTVSQIAHESLQELIGGRQREMVNPKLRKDIARQWWEAFATTTSQTDRMPRLPGMSAHTIIALSDAAMRVRDISPREVAGYIQSVPRLYNLAKDANGGSVARARMFFRDPAVMRSVQRNARDTQALEFFRELEKVSANGWLSGKEAISDIYKQLGLE